MLGPDVWQLLNQADDERGNKYGDAASANPVGLSLSELPTCRRLEFRDGSISSIGFNCTSPPAKETPTINV